MGMKAPSIVSAIQQDLSDGYACVIQVVSTGESLLKRRLEMMDPDDELVEGALTPATTFYAELRITHIMLSCALAALLDARAYS